MLKKKKIRQLEKTLRAQLLELSEDLTQTHDLGAERSLRDSVKELSAYDNHPADLGSEAFEQVKDLGLANAFRVRQAAIEGPPRVNRNLWCLSKVRPFDR